MTAELLVNVTPSETRVAYISGAYHKRSTLKERSQTRSCRKHLQRSGKSRVLPGMQAAFIDIGLEKAAFYMLLILCLSHGMYRG